MGRETSAMRKGTLSALDGDGGEVTFTDYVYEGDVVDVYRTFEDAEEERGSFERRLVCREEDEWWLDSPSGPGESDG